MEKRGAESDESLAERAKRGSEEAFGELVERFHRPVFSLLVRMVRQSELAEDLAQESFLKAWKSLARFDAERKFSSWIFKIAHNTALDELRRGGLETISLDAPFEAGDDPPEMPADLAAEDPLLRTLARESVRVLEQAIAHLRPAYRGILLLRFAQEMAYDEIAEVLGVPLGTVKIHIYRARAELLKEMRALGLDPEPPAMKPGGGTPVGPTGER
ncbi:MAG: sigma-70 family RNA polymerase sigma factor [Thermoanaerobaculia bacterium]